MVRLRARIGRGYLVSVSALVLVLVSMLVAFQVTRMETAKVHDNHIASIQVAGQLLNLVEHMDNLEFLYAAGGRDREAQLEEFDRTAAEFDRAYVQAEAMVELPSEAAHYAEIGRQYGAFRHVHDRMRALAAEGRWAEARTLNATESHRAHVALRNAGLAFLQTNVEAAGKSRQVEDRTLWLTEGAAVSFAVLGAVIAGVVWRQVIRDVIVPLRELRTATNALAAGRAVALPEPRESGIEEIIELQTDFHRMATELVRVTEALQATNEHLEAQVAARTTALVEANARLEANLAELQALDKLKSQFVAVTSHELLTPIAFIVGFASSLDDGLMGPLTESQAAAVRKILGGADRLTRMVRNTLEFSRLEAGQLMVYNEAIAVDDIAQRVYSDHEEAAQAAGLTFDLELAPEVPEAFADPDRVAQVLSELVDNAIKFTAEGGQIRMRVLTSGDRVVCEVADTGPGIPAEAAERLSQPFYQVDSSVTRRHGGLGLGLTLAHRLAQRMGGKLELRSRVGQGSTFRLLLPALTAETPHGTLDAGLREGKG